MQWPGLSSLALATGLSLGGCGTGSSDSTQAPGALVAVSMNGTVGVPLVEVPPAMRDRVAQSLLARPRSFRTARAKRQIDLTTYRLVFRQASHAKMKYTGKDGLPITSDSGWNVTFDGGARRGSAQGPSGATTT